MPSVTANAAADPAALYRQGLALASEGAWTRALDRFLEAARLERAPRPHLTGADGVAIAAYDPQFHIARCLVELGRYREAVVPLGVSARAGVTDRAQIEGLRARIDAGLGHPPARRVARNAARLHVASEPPGAVVLLDGVPIGETPLDTAPLTAGEHTLRIEAESFEPAEQVVRLQPGPNTVRVALRAAAATHPPPSTATAQAHAVPAPTAPATALAPPPSPAAAAPSPLLAAPTPLPSPGADGDALLATPTFAIEPLDLSAPPGPSALTLAVLGALVFAVVGVVAALYRRRSHDARPGAAATLTPTAPTVLTTTPARLGNYLVVGTLGRGGMATTYEARRESDGARVALKVPHEACLAEASFVSRFLREGALGEQLHHPHIVRILEASEADGRPFLAMELLEGHTLKQELRTVGRLGLRQALLFARDIAQALDYAHAKGVVHRDLKPENIMLLADGALKVMDFGIARLTGHEGLTTASLFLGTPLYAAPEMIEPTSVDHRVDLYALGIILFEMLQGTVPFSADSPYRVLEMHMRTPLPDASRLARPVPGAVWSIVERLCAKRREDRHASAQALLVELNLLLHNFTTLGLDDDG